MDRPLQHSYRPVSSMISKLPVELFLFFFSNVRSVMNKRTDLSSLIDTCKVDIVVLTDTWLSPSVTNDKILECSVAFNIYCDRDNRLGGGVLIAISDLLRSYIVPTTCSLELICVCSRINHRNIISCCCYRLPVFSSSFCTDLHDT